MGIHEFAYDFGAVTAANVAMFDIDSVFRGNANVPQTARIYYAIVRNNSIGAVTVQGSKGASIVGIGQVKRIEFQPPARYFTVNPASTTSAGQLTADVGVEGTRF